MVVLRLARNDDTRLFLDLRNDPESVRQSGGTPVDGASHQGWFSVALRDPTCRLWVAVADGRDIGYVRLRIAEQVGLISMAIRPGDRGAGYGLALLRALQEVVSGDDGIDILEGEVEPSNLASLAVFHRAGFVRIESIGSRRLLRWQRPQSSGHRS